MKKTNAFWTLNCGCDSEEFAIEYVPEGEYYEVICNECGSVVARIPRYAFEWLNEEAQNEEDE